MDVSLAPEGAPVSTSQVSQEPTKSVPWHHGHGVETVSVRPNHEPLTQSEGVLGVSEVGLLRD